LCQVSIMLSVANKHIMLIVVMLNVVAPFFLKEDRDMKNV
jgi:hypothetical protein